MIDILTGIRNAWRSDSTLSNAINGMYFSVAPKDAVMPYVTYHMITNYPTWGFVSNSRGVTTYENLLVQFNIYSETENSPSEVIQIHSDLIKLYDSTTITMENHTQVMLKRSGSPILTRIGDDPVWVYSCDYSAMMERDDTMPVDDTAEV